MQELTRRGWDIVRRDVVEGVEMLDMAYRDGFRTPEHQHEWGSLHFVTRGRVEELYGSRTRSGGEGTLLHYAAGTHHVTHISGREPRIFHVPLRSPAYRDLSDEDLAREIDLRSTRMTELVFALFLEHRSGEPLCPLSVACLAAELVAEMRKQTAGDERAPRWLEEVRDYLHDLQDETPSLAAIARTVGRHRSQVARAFRRRYGCTLGQYVRRLRIRRAAALLAGTREPLSRIALETGFADQSHLGRTFKRQMGISPARFRSMFD